MELLGEGKGQFGCDFKQEGVLAKNITDREVISGFEGEIIGCDLLPWAVGHVLGQHGLCLQ